MVKFRRQTSKPAASSAPPRRATAPREKKPYMDLLHTRVNECWLAIEMSMYDVAPIRMAVLKSAHALIARANHYRC